ncbi:hypothetical protein K504DRAFT_369956 [Pleomassaria siparia CBS 279.74]|uniref:60S ribosomal protein L20 n=1 Tax=Pleomassaria siparia CBS 279.74 TaxID=1314801 RepID=A0A6G1KL00_9PLEO|nr:hypothetical protein K504DRAFT_369956 [Pleomassaria siparia CBS 279.74]
MSTSTPITRLCTKAPRTSLLPFVQLRHESTSRRHKKLMHLPEAPSYTPTRSAPTLVFNPPSSAPSAYHTPLKFLPPNDRRRKLNTEALKYASATSHRQQTSALAAPGTPLHIASHLPPKPSSMLPPPVRKPYEKKYTLGEVEIAEIRRLRLSDPDKWTRVKLAEKFGCTQFFVGMLVRVPEKHQRVETSHQKARDMWGERRRGAREDRIRRRAMWGRDE